MANTDTLIRTAGPEDVPALGALGALIVTMHHELDPGRFMAPTAETEGGYGAFLATQLDHPTAFVLCAVQNGRVVGYSYGGVEEMDFMALRGRAGAIYDIVVDPAHRECGIGRRLLSATLAELRARGIRQVVLMTAMRNDGGRRFFSKAGFRPTMIEMTHEMD